MMNKKFKKLKKTPLIFTLILITLSIAGVTYALFSSRESFENNFTVGKPDVVLEEIFPDDKITPDKEIEKKVSVRNKGTAPMVVRLNVAETWIKTLEDNTTIILNNQVNTENVMTKKWSTNFSENWIEKDGYYYYKKVLNAEEKVDVFESITFPSKYATDDYGYNDSNVEYNLDFYIESVQASKEAIKELWDITATIEGGDVIWSF